MGIALSKTIEDRPEDLLRRADLAMYAAKSRAKARHEIFDPSMDTRAAERSQLENELRWAVERQSSRFTTSPLPSCAPAGSTP